MPTKAKQNTTAKVNKPEAATAARVNKDVKVQARMDAELKQAAEKIFEELGVSPTEAIRMFYTQVRIHRGFPFDLKVPNAITLAAIEETEHPETLESCDDLDGFFDNL
jgi:DNA-damage-inducible protein J